MYLGNNILEIAKVAGGYLIEIKVPIDMKKKTKDNFTLEQALDRHLFKSDAKGLGESLEFILPLLEEHYDSEKDFDNAFEEAMKEAEKDAKKEKKEKK